MTMLTLSFIGICIGAYLDEPIVVISVGFLGIMFFLYGILTELIKIGKIK